MARPSYKPTADQRRTVAIAAAAGMSHAEIAAGLEISRPTLYKHFELELSVGAIKKRFEVLKFMHTAASKGNVAAQKALLGLTPTPAAPPAEGESTSSDPAKGVGAPAKAKADPPAAALVVGKKEQAQLDAVTAQVGTGWEDLLDPKAPVQ